VIGRTGRGIVGDVIEGCASGGGIPGRRTGVGDSS
jgi:hypothetical protein